MSVTRRSVAVLAVAVIIVVVAPISDRSPSPVGGRHLGHGAPLGPRFDEPDAAAEFARLKRRASSPDFDTIAAYRAARAHVNAMPRYSTRLDRPVDRASSGVVPSSLKFVAPRALDRWTPLGPGNIGGRTRTLVIRPDEPDTMYCGGVSGGVWKTTDGGRSWVPIADELTNIAVNSMAMHPEDPDVLYVGTGEGHFREIVRGTWLPLRGGGIYRTADGGATWSQLQSTDNPDFYFVNDLIISPHDGDRIYAATRTGVWISENAGSSWRRSLDPQVNGGCLDIAVRSDRPSDWVFAACGTFERSTVYRLKANEGDVWEAVLSEPTMGRTSLAIAPSDQGTIYALAASNSPGPGGHFEQALHAVYRSRSGGSPGSWQVQVDNSDPAKVNTLLLTNPAGSSYVECGWDEQNAWVPMGWYCNVIAVDPVNPDVVWAAGVDLFRSDDGGRNWGLASYWWASYDPWDPSFAHADQHTIVFHPDYDGTSITTMFAANDGGVFRTDNPYATVGTSEAAICDPAYSSVMFEDLNHDLGITQFYHGAVFPGGDAWIGGTQDNGTIRGLDQWGRNGWRFVSGGDGGYVAIDPDDPDTLFVESQWLGLLRSFDGGQSFASATSGITEASANFLFITPFVMDPNDADRLWTGGRRLWRTENASLSWNAASIYLPGGSKVSALAVEPGDSQSVLVGTTDGFIYRNRQALAAGSTTVWDSSRPRDGFVSSITYDPASTDTVYATYAGFGGRHVWRSLDGGVTWGDIDGRGAASVPDIPVHSVVVDPTHGDRLYLGTDLGVMTTLNGGRTWAEENTGFANAVTEWLALGSDAHGDPWLYAFTHGRGAWKVALNPLPPPPRLPSGRRTP